MNRMQSDYYYPSTADRRTPQVWSDSGAEDLLDIARGKTRALLDEPEPTHISAGLDARIRAAFPIHLPARKREIQ